LRHFSCPAKSPEGNALSEKKYIFLPFSKERFLSDFLILTEEKDELQTKLKKNFKLPTTR